VSLGPPRESDTLESGTVVAGRYVVREPIARGGFSVLYRVEHVHTGEALAMKVLDRNVRFDPEALARFKREIRTSSKIRSEHVVHVTDADTASELDGAPFMVMELLRGSDLEAHAVREGPLPAERVISILGQVASALEQAHALGIVHRDLKPGNLFLHERADGTTVAKVLDFGISKFTTKDDEGVSVTTTGVVLGTPLYMAPEQAHGQNDQVGPATDIWALGLIALRLLFGEHYWGQPTMAELMVKITTAPIRPPSERWPGSPRTSPLLDAWFLRSCARDPSERWTSVGEQIRELDAALGVSNVALATTLLDASPSRTRAAPGRSRRTIALGFAAVAISGAALFSMTRLPTAGNDVENRALPSATEMPSAAEARTRPETPPTTSPTALAPSLESVPSSVPSVKAATRAVVVTSTVAAKAPAAPPSPVDSATTCRESEVLSFGHCCPSGHVWHSGACIRPFATSF
jgi:serine/threonine-protein kinase